MLHKKTQNNFIGFTLVEMSMVVIVIGLIAGAILGGKNMIAASKMRATLTELADISSSIHSFQDKYNCLPGDCARAAELISTASNGDGNGKIAQFLIYDNYTNTNEMWQVWLQLVKAELWKGKGTFTGASIGGYQLDYSGPGVNVPASPMAKDAGYTVVHWGGYSWNDWSSGGGSKILNHAIVYGTPADFWGYRSTIGGNLTTAEAFAMDTKVDDGKPGTGHWIHASPQYWTSCATSATPTTSTYSTTAGRVCNALIELDF